MGLINFLPLKKGGGGAYLGGVNLMEDLRYIVLTTGLKINAVTWEVNADNSTAKCCSSL